MQVIKVSLCCDIWLNFALVTVQSCAVYMEMYKGLCHCAIPQRKIAGSFPLLPVGYKFSPKLSPIKTKPQPH